MLFPKCQSLNNCHTWLQGGGDESCWQETASIRFRTKQEKQERRSKELMRSKALNPPSLLVTAQFCLGKQLLVLSPVINTPKLFCPPDVTLCLSSHLMSHTSHLTSHHLCGDHSGLWCKRRSLRSLCYNKFSPAGLSPGLLDSHILSLHSQLQVPPPSPACWGRSVPEHEGNIHLLLLSVFSPSLTSLRPVSKRFHQLSPLLSTASALVSYFCLTSFLYKVVFYQHLLGVHILGPF